jgi:GDPmannose 4,6-dehydratase
MLQQEAADDFVIATGQSNSLEDFVEAAFAAVGLSWRDHVETDASLLRPSDIEESVGNPSRAARVLGWTPRLRMRDVVQRMIEGETG